MNQNSLGDFRSDPSKLPNDGKAQEKGRAGIGQASASHYHQELNTLKIEKLSQRITIISVILPCIIIAILAFAYIDIKERVVDVDQTKGDQVARMAQTLEEKLSALDVRIAKAKFELDENLPQLSQKSLAMETRVAKLVTAKADAKALKTAVKRLEKSIKTNRAKAQKAAQSIEKVSGRLQKAVKENSLAFKAGADKSAAQIKQLKQELTGSLEAISAYEEQIAKLAKDVSILNKQLKALENDTGQSLARSISQVEKRFNTKLQSLSKQIQKRETRPAPSQPKQAKTAPAKGSTIKPKVSVPSSGKALTPPKPAEKMAPAISEETLTQ